MKSLNHFLALLVKNYYVSKRNYLGSLLEVILPIVLVLLLVVIKGTYTDKTEPLPDQKVFQTSPLSYMTSPDYSYSLCSFYQSIGGSWAYGLVSKNDLTDYLELQFKTHPNTANLSVIYFNSTSELDSYIKAEKYEQGKKLCFAVEINNFTESVVDYSFRFNSSYVYSAKSPFVGGYIDAFNFNRKETISEALQESDPNYLFQYLSSGYLQTHNFISNYILKKKGINKEIVVNYKAIDQTDMKKDSFLLIIKLVMAICSYVAYLVPLCRMISAVLKEREDRAKELLIIMGISNNCYWSSWLFYYFFVYTIISLAVSATLVLSLLKKSSFFWVFLVYWIFGMFCLFYSQFISIFFRKAKNAILVSIVLYMICFLSGYGFTTSSESTMTLASLVPCIGFHFAINCIFDLEVANLGLNQSTMTYTIKNYSMIDIFFTFPFAILLLITFSIYFELILPSGYQNKSWNFFLKPDYCKKKNKARIAPIIEDITHISQFMENVDSALEAQKRSKQAIMIRGLSKTFGTRKVVKRINLDLYEGQIFSLLGHNGSGKTTTISMLTGVLEPTEGEMKIGELLLSEDIEKIREILGVCLQENILFSLLTPYEHIIIFSIFKSIPFSAIKKEFIDEKLAEVKLLEAKNTPAGKLSGGQKRKLCLAIALLGDSKLVILDEPTSGMDLNSRRHVWDLLKNNKRERIIIITTHYMEEADIISDRVSILIEGEIKCCGSPLFLKSQFGGGYYLSLSKMHNVSGKDHTKKITSFLESNLGFHFTLINDFQSEITFQIPFEFSKNCIEFFKALDQQLEDLALRGYSISVTTLEEVFRKVMKSKASLAENKPDDSEDYRVFSEMSPLKISKKSKLGSKQLLSIIKKRAIISKRDYKSTLIEIFSPLLFLIVTFLMMFWNPMIVSTYPLDLSSNIYPEGFLAYSPSQLSDKYLLYLYTEVFSDKNSSQIRDSDVYAKVSFSSDSPINFTLSVNQQVLHSSAFYSHQIIQSILKELNSGVELKPNNYPFPATNLQHSIYAMGSGLTLIIGLGIGFSFVPSSIALFMSRERELGVKHLHLISGLNSLIYWLGNFIWDLCKQLITTGFALVFISVAGFDMLKGDSSYSMTYCLISAYSISSLLFSYLLTFLFKSSALVNVNSLIVHILTGALFPNLIMIVLNFPSVRSGIYSVMWVIRLFPNFTLNWGFMKIANKTYIAVMTDSTEVPDDFSWDGTLPDLVMMVVQSVFFIICLIIAENIESRPDFCTRRAKANNIISAIPSYDEDVEIETQTAQETDPNDVVVNIKSLVKIYPNRKHSVLAVDDLSLNIYKGECFSILGVNGAGKTTTFKILTGTVSPTEGQVFVHGHNIKTEIHKVRESIGYCPQLDVINELLTARETLEIYADFRGIPSYDKRATVNTVIELVGLKEQADYVCGFYSGGNKRKLCLGIAILGFPELVILDEPTAGMDPESRKQVWQVLTELKSHQCSVILTSHSMDEAENVSDRITIMTGGKLRCLGSPSYIRHKFGDDFELQMKLDSPTQFDIYDFKEEIRSVDTEKELDKDAVGLVLKDIDCVKYFALINQRRSGSAIYWALEKNGVIPVNDLLAWLLIEKQGDNVLGFLRENFREVKIEEHYLTFFKLKIANDENISLGGIFDLIERNKALLKIGGYSLSQTTLDQIFNRFAMPVIPGSPTFVTKTMSFSMTRLSEKT